MANYAISESTQTDFESLATGCWRAFGCKCSWSKRYGGTFSENHLFRDLRDVRRAKALVFCGCESHPAAWSF